MHYTTPRFLSFLFLFVVTLGYAQKSFAPESERQQVEKAICGFKFGEAARLSESLSGEYKFFYLSNISFYKYLATQDNALLDGYYNDWENAVSFAENMPTTEANRNLMLSELYGKRAVLEFLNQDYVRASLHTKDSHAYIQTNAQLFPSESGNKKMLGAFNIILSNVPKKFQWFFNLLGFKGNSQTGYEQLKIAAKDKSCLLHHEVNIILYFVERNLLGKLEAAKQRLLDEKELSGSGMLTDFMLASAYISLNDNESAYAILVNKAKYEEQSDVFFITYWNYMLGKCLLFKEKYVEAIPVFEEFLDKNQGALFISDARFKLGLAYMLGKDYPTAQKHFQRVKERENAFDEDEYAIATARRFGRVQPSYYTKLLYRTRNLFDGGYYTDCINLLDKVKKELGSLSQENQLEMFYRYGRTYHKSDYPNAAKAAYQACIGIPHSGNMKYMQAYSAYYLGELYKKEGNKDMAKKYYKQAQSYTDFPYESGLESKLKYALSKL